MTQGSLELSPASLYTGHLHPPEEFSVNPNLDVRFLHHTGMVTLKRILFFCVAGCSVMLAPAMIPTLHAGAPLNPPKAQVDIHKLVRNMAWNELQASEHPAHYYRYLNRNLSPDGARTTDQIGTSQGVAERLVAVNGKPPNAQQRAANDQLLSKLVHSPRFRQSRLKDQKQDTARRDNVIKNLPQAFIYTFLGKTPDGLVHLKFRPDPNFSPSSRQALVLEGMAGQLWIDPSSQRMVKIDGTLIKDVTIGWGLLARLKKGGRFLMEQSQGTDGTWHQKLLSVDFDGSVLIFKSIHVHERIIRCCFKEVPDKLTMAQAVQMLRTQTTLPEHWESRLDAIEKPVKSF